MRTWLTVAAILIVMLFLAILLGTTSSNEREIHHYQRLKPTMIDLAERDFLQKRASRAKSLVAVASASTTTSSTSKPKVSPHKTNTSPKSTNTAPSTGDIWHALAMCETGGTMNQRIVSRNGLYFSYFQWSLSTFHSIGGQGDPRDVDYETQKSLAQKLQARSGWGQWPVCSRKLGLR